MLTVVTEEEVYRYSNENEIEFIKKQLDGRTWIELPTYVEGTEKLTTINGVEYEVSYQHTTTIPRSRIIEISQTDKIFKL